LQLDSVINIKVMNWQNGVFCPIFYTTHGKISKALQPHSYKLQERSVTTYGKRWL